MTAPKDAVDWCHRTGHCGGCGQPGAFCLCRTPCPCAHLHQCGSGLTADPTETFADPLPDQDGLWDA